MPSADNGAALAPAAPPHRLEYIDGIRALAALWVALHHTIETSEPQRWLHMPVVGPVLASLFFGQFPVMIFLMLSGFCLYYPYVKKNPTQPEFNTGFREYLRRRFTRIAPPYLWALGFCLVMAAIPQLQVGRWQLVGPVEIGTVVSHLLFVHNLIPAYATKIDYPMWSIGLEWQLYLLFPFLIWAFRKSNALVVTGVALVVAAIIRVSYRHVPEALGAVLHDGPFSYLEIFSAGMLAAALTAQRRVLRPKWLLGVIAVGGLLAVRFGSGNGLAHDLSTSASAFCILMLASDPNGALSRFLSKTWLVRIGFFSYSFYLVHAPLVHLFWLAQRPLKLSPEGSFALLALVCMPLIVLLSYGFHCLFERPFMRVRPALASTAARAPQVEVAPP